MAIGIFFGGADVRFTFIEQHVRTWPVRLMCRVLDVRAGGYCGWKADRPAADVQSV
jgi:hypothetical protein